MWPWITLPIRRWTYFVAEHFVTLGHTRSHDPEPTTGAKTVDPTRLRDDIVVMRLAKLTGEPTPDCDRRLT